MILTEKDTGARFRQYADAMRHVVLAVVGTPRSGKSTFIQHALDLKRLPSSKISTKKVSLEGIVSVLQIHELNVHNIKTKSDGTPLWRPEHTDDDITDKVNGVVVVYNINDLASTKPIPAVLRKFYHQYRTSCSMARSCNPTYGMNTHVVMLFNQASFRVVNCQ